MYRRDKYLSNCIERASDREMDEWYADQNEEFEEELDRNANKCQFEEAYVKLTTSAHDYDFNI